MRVGFFSAKNYFDQNAFSGTLFSMFRNLDAHPAMEIVPLGSPRTPNRALRVRKRFDSLVTHRFSTREARRDRALDAFRKQVHQQLQKHPVDVIFAPVGKEELWTFETDVPVVYLSDVTFDLYNAEYGAYTASISSAEADLQQKMERDAISRSTALVYPSEWARESAVGSYGADRTSTHVVPFGANVEGVPSWATVEAAKVMKEGDRTVRLLFVGVSWERKGGSIAMDCLRHLVDNGVDAELTIVGCVPPSDEEHPNARVIPFLDKNIPEQVEELKQIFMQSHFMLFPTRADCSPIIVCEANAFGLPVVAAAVGGMPSLIDPGTNGFLHPLDAGGEAYARSIHEIWTSPERYEMLTKNSRSEYDSRLNWTAWANSMECILRGIVERAASSREAS